jgi:hypothetical protein
MVSPQHRYDNSFMQLTAQARRSAELVINIVRGSLVIGSVADFGCALGTWLSAWRDTGISDITGIDGAYVDLDQLSIPRDQFRTHDLALPIDLGRRFDLVESMEVAEHLPHSAAEGFVATLVRHSDIVLFSAAPPGQGGEHHINEQDYNYWRVRFAKHGYGMFDWIRPQISGLRAVQFWYRYNLFLFVAQGKVAGLPAVIRRSEILPSQPIRDLSPLAFRLRKQFVRALPSRLQTNISRALSRMQR